MPQPLLGERFRDRIPTRSLEDLHAHLNAEEQRFILWAFKEKWSAARIGRALKMNSATALRFRNRYWRQPRLLLELGLFEMVSGPVKDEYRCLVCGDRMKSRKSVERHVLGHYLEEPVVESVLGKDEDENEDG